MIEPEKMHEVYKDEEVINVQMRVKDYKTLMNIIERERSMKVVAKWLFTILGGITTFYAFLKLGIFSKMGV